MTPQDATPKKLGAALKPVPSFSSDYGALGREMSRLAGEFTVSGPFYVRVNWFPAWQVVIPGNQQRYALMYWAYATDKLHVSPNNPPPLSVGFSVVCDGTEHNYNYKKLGPLVCQPWYMRDEGAGIDMAWIEVVTNS